MNNHVVLEKYKGVSNKPLAMLKDGGVIIGTEVDEQNHLHYVIQRENNLVIESASRKKIQHRFIEHKPFQVTVDIKTKTITIEKNNGI